MCGLHLDPNLHKPNERNYPLFSCKFKLGLEMAVTENWITLEKGP